MEPGGEEGPAFGRTYWRRPSVVEQVLPDLADGVLDDASVRLLGDSIPTLCWIARGDGFIVWYNRGWHEYCGTVPADMEGWGWQSVHDPVQLPAVLDRWTASIATGEPFEMVFPLRGADGVFRPFLTRIMPLRDGGGTIRRWFGVNTDISAQVAAEHALHAVRDELAHLNGDLERRVGERTAELMLAEEQLRQAQKMEAVGQFTGGLAHDFNNLLAGISGSLELMQARITQGRLKDIDRYMAAAQGATRRAAALTHRLLAFSRQQTLMPRPIDVNALIAGMLDLVQRTVGPSIGVETVAMAGLWPALADPHQLENALLNLCINARDAMPGGGRITIETGNRWIDRHGARQFDVPEGQYLSLCVSDTGTGMTPEVMAKAFDPFFTTKPLGEGTGLGLSMIYGFAKQSGGQVRIYSELGQGTMVCIYLPRHRGEAGALEALPERRAVPVAGAGETVLVVDDEPTVRMLVADVLGDLGYTAIEAVDGAGGLKVLQSDARIDLLVSDIGLPGGMNGRQMVDIARLTRPDLKVLFITGFAENALLNNGQLEPGMSVLTKPFAVDTLAARIREMIVR